MDVIAYLQVISLRARFFSQCGSWFDWIEFRVGFHSFTQPDETILQRRFI